VRWNLNRKSAAGLALTLVILVGAEFLAYWRLQRLIETSRQASQTQEVLDVLESILGAMDGAEAHQRGYLLTGDDSYLGLYHADIAQVPALLERLRSFAGADSVREGQIASLARLIEARNENLSRTVEIRKQQGIRFASKAVLSGVGRQRMDALRTALLKVETEERDLLRNQISDWEASGRVMTDALIFALMLVFAVLILSVLAINREASERLEVQQLFHQSETRMRLLVESARDYAILMLDPHGRVTNWSPSAERIKGYKAEEIIGQNWSRFFPSEDIQAGKPERELEKALAESRAEDEGWRVRKDGSLFWASVVIAPVHDKGGQLLGFSEVTRDVSERKQAQEEIQELNRHLKHRASELEAANKDLEGFTYSVSHDLRAPLRHIDGFSQLLVEEYGPQLSKEVQRYLARIQGGVKQMGHLVDDLLHLARLGRQEIRLQVTGLDSLVEEVVGELKAESGERAIDWRISSLPFVECDPGLLKQVFANLLSNAVKYTRPRELAVIEVGSVNGNGEPTVFVRDNGVGFSMKYADKLFGVFQRLHRAEDFEGTGVGLATVQRIIHKHGGRVWAEAELDKGATFYFTLQHLESQLQKTA
jgi:PAS domain S-box-containing protein